VVLYLLVKDPLCQIYTLKDNQHITIDNVILREIDAQQNTKDYIIKVDNINLNVILAYYCRSVVRPVLIHKEAIEAYNSLPSAKKHITNPLFKAQSVYEGNYNNTGLEKLKHDICFASIADKYFTYTKEHNIINDIEKIGTILENIRFIN
jgi:hypothetical protein